MLKTECRLRAGEPLAACGAERFRAAGYFTTRADSGQKVNARTSGVYVRADPGDASLLDGGDDQVCASMIADRLQRWKSITKA